MVGLKDMFEQDEEAETTFSDDSSSEGEVTDLEEEDEPRDR